jgi:hypothetical protein
MGSLPAAQERTNQTEFVRVAKSGGRNRAQRDIRFLLGRALRLVGGECDGHARSLCGKAPRQQSEIIEVEIAK